MASMIILTLRAKRLNFFRPLCPGSLALVVF
jgi:hypothetical protein